jgi:hypothetical protein
MIARFIKTALLQFCVLKLQGQSASIVYDPPMCGNRGSYTYTFSNYPLGNHGHGSHDGHGH